MDVRGELGKILGSVRLHPDQYEPLVRLLMSQEAKIRALQRAPAAPARDLRGMEASYREMEDTVRDRGATIHQCNDSIHHLKVQLREAEGVISTQSRDLRHLRSDLRASRERFNDEHEKRNAETRALWKQIEAKSSAAGKRQNRDPDNTGRLFEQEKAIKGLRQKVTVLEEAQEEQDTALLLATTFQKDAHEKRRKLEGVLGQRDNLIITLHGQISALQNQIYNLTYVY